MGRGSGFARCLAVAYGASACLSVPPPDTLTDAALPDPTSDGAPALPDGLIARYPFDRTAAQATADVAGAFDAACIESCPTDFTDGAVDGALDFGAGRALAIPDVPELRLAEATVALWVRRSGAADATIIGKTIGSGVENSWEIFYGGTGEVQVAVFPGELIVHSTGRILPFDAWTHVAMTWSPSTCKIFLDGSLESSFGLPGSPAYDEHPIMVGVDIEMEVPAYPFVGSLDELQIYGRALEASEIEELAER